MVEERGIGDDNQSETCILEEVPNKVAEVQVEVLEDRLRYFCLAIITSSHIGHDHSQVDKAFIFF